MFGNFEIYKLNLFNLIIVFAISCYDIASIFFGADPLWAVIGLIGAFAFGYFNAGYLAPIIRGSENWAFFWGFVLGIIGVVLYILHVGLTHYLAEYERQSKTPTK